jgi:uncharacterized protein
LSEYFVDTSALAKRYIIETGASWVRNWVSLKAGNMIVISRLTTVEIVSILARKQREGILSTLDIARIRNNFFAHVRKQYVVVEMDTNILSTARKLLIKYPLRILDAIQLSSALQAAKTLNIRPTFATADTRLLAAASSEGLPTDNPNAHP